MANSLAQRVKEIRLAASMKLGEKINQKDASEIINSDRRWQKYEMDPKQVDLAAIELFCLKTGLKFYPEILDSNDPIEFSASGPQAALSSSGFITLTKVDETSISINSGFIVQYFYNQKEKATEIILSTGYKLLVKERPGVISDVLGTNSAQEKVFS